MRVMERVHAGELKMVLESITRKTQTRTDYKGRVLTQNENSLVVDTVFQPTDPRHTVAKVHRHLTDNGEAGESGLYDPKTITTKEGIKYQPLPYETSRCELCEAGDVIFPSERFMFSKWYRPSYIRCIWIKIRAKINL